MVSERLESWTGDVGTPGYRKGRAERPATGSGTGPATGLEQGLQRQRHGLLRLVRKRFGVEMAEQSAVLLQNIDDSELLGDLFDQVLDRADGEGWLRVLRPLANTRLATDADAGKTG